MDRLFIIPAANFFPPPPDFRGTWKFIQNLYSNLTPLQEYFKNPLNLKTNSILSQQLLLKCAPSARSLIFIKQAINKLKASRSREEL